MKYYIGDSSTLLFKTDKVTTWAMLLKEYDKKWTIFSDYGFGMGYAKRKQIPDLFIILKGRTL